VELLKGLGTSVYIDDCEEHLRVIRREIPRCQTFLTRP
jgi:hypothetical protein